MSPCFFLRRCCSSSATLTPDPVPGNLSATQKVSCCHACLDCLPGPGAAAPGPASAALGASPLPAAAKGPKASPTFAAPAAGPPAPHAPHASAAAGPWPGTATVRLALPPEADAALSACERPPRPAAPHGGGAGATAGPGPGAPSVESEGPPGPSPATCTSSPAPESFGGGKVPASPAHRKRAEGGSRTAPTWEEPEGPAPAEGADECDGGAPEEEGWGNGAEKEESTRGAKGAARSRMPAG